MFMNLFVDRVTDANGAPVQCLQLTYAEDGTTPVTVYTDDDHTTPHEWPIESDAGGILPNRHIPAGKYRVVVAVHDGYDVHGDPVVGDTIFDIPAFVQAEASQVLLDAVAGAIPDADGVVQPENMAVATAGSLYGVPTDSGFDEHPRPVSGLWLRATKLNVELSRRAHRFPDGDYDLIAYDLYYRIMLWKDADQTIHLSQDVSDQIEKGHFIEIGVYQGGGVKTISVDPGLTLNSIAGGSETIRTQVKGVASVVRLLKVNDAGDWILHGDVSAPVLLDEVLFNTSASLSANDAQSRIVLFGDNDLTLTMAAAVSDDLPNGTEYDIVWGDGSGGVKTIEVTGGVELNGVANGSVDLLPRTDGFTPRVILRKNAANKWITIGSTSSPIIREPVWVDADRDFQTKDTRRQIQVHTGGTFTLTMTQDVSDRIPIGASILVLWTAGTSGTKTIAFDSPLALDDVTGGSCTITTRTAGVTPAVMLRKINDDKWTSEGNVGVTS